MGDENTPQLHARDIGQDIRECGTLLGNAIQNQESADALETVESLRTAAIGYREDQRASREFIHETLDSLTPEQQRIIARAFTSYFELTNLAEERERVRTLRREKQDGVPADSLAEAAAELASFEDIQQVFEDVLIEPTFTAHPTEARRKTVKAKLRAVTRHLEDLDERRLTDDERDRITRELTAEILGLWGTPQVRDRRPKPEDEARNVQWYLENTLFDVVPRVYEELERSLSDRNIDIDIPKLFEFRTWAGSDRDGNPFVTSDVTERTLARQRRVILQRYDERLDELLNVLSQDGDRIANDEQLQSVFQVPAVLSPVRETARERYPTTPYRQAVLVMRERLRRVGNVRPGEYENAREFQSDLERIADNLRTNGNEIIAKTEVDPLIRQVETFGFTLASMDVRDHQKQHTQALGEALRREGIDYAEYTETERVEFLTAAIGQDEPLITLEETSDLSETSARVLERFRRLADWQREYGSQAIDTYCISMTEEPSHVLEVLFLADQAGIVDLPGYSGLDIVPLLETERALSEARRIMGTLFENKAYEAALAARGWTQEIMLGYSDSNKENGFLAANWSLYENQRNLADIATEYDVTLRLFHGRGGSISRGGGPMNEALRALPNSTVTGQVKFTEQGEAIGEKYGNVRIAERNLEQMLNAQLRARKNALEQPEEALETEWVEAIEIMADAAREEYHDLLETDGFVTYFGQATPIDVIEDLNLGSRPASRSEKRSVEDLRAIPWVFSWTQCRCILPGWYGLATGIERYLETGEIDVLQEMYENWPFFRTTLDNARQALARTEMEISAEYAALADDELESEFFPRLEEEYETAVELMTEIRQREDIIERDWLRESLRRRNPYTDLLNLLQVNLLELDSRNQIEEQTLRLTVKGIAAGMKNTG